MTAARLSPAANLLRNSRLFALPAALSLPPVEPSSELIAQSDTATTPYPIRAALETPLHALNRGDWGLKRSLPTKTTTKSGTPTIRIRGGIDTPEHIADFESAGDHVITLRKYQELNLRLTLPQDKSTQARYNRRTSAFKSETDHTTDSTARTLKEENVSNFWLEAKNSERASRMPQHLRKTLEEIAEEEAAAAANAGLEAPDTTEHQPTPTTPSMPSMPGRRWRYSGPFLAGLNGLEFEAFLKKITREKKAAFRAYVKDRLTAQRWEQRRAKALDRGDAESTQQPLPEVADEEVTEYLRELRAEPGNFGPLIAEFFDLADGPKTPSEMTDPWSYGRDTISADQYRDSGPPRTHPSAGLSYLKSEMFSHNDTMIGPREKRPPVAARLLKTTPADHNQVIPSIGVAGFVVPRPQRNGELTDPTYKWEVQKDGPKMVVSPVAAQMSQAGKVEIQVNNMSEWVLEDDVPIPDTDQKPKEISDYSGLLSRSSQLPQLDRTLIRRRPPVEPSQDITAELDLLQRMATK